MYLTREEEGMLSGAYGEAVKFAMQILTRMGEAYGVEWSSQNVSFRMWGSGWEYHIDTATIPLGAWRHVAIVVDKSHTDTQTIDFYIDGKLDKLDEGLSNMENTIHQFKENLTLQINQLIENTFLQNINQIIDSFDKNLGDLDGINEMNEIVLQTLEPDYVELEKLFNIIDPTKSRIKGALEDNQEMILNNFGKKLPHIKNIFSNLDKDLRKLLSDLKAAILVLEGSKGPVLNKIEKLENEKKNLHNTIRELKNEIKELKK